MQYLSIDVTPSLIVLATGVCCVALLYCLEMWAERHTSKRTRAEIAAANIPAEQPAALGADRIPAEQPAALGGDHHR